MRLSTILLAAAIGSAASLSNAQTHLNANASGPGVIYHPTLNTSGYTLPISVKAGNVTAGDTKYYQCWYRNPAGSPCGTDFNASNGYAVTWTP